MLELLWLVFGLAGLWLGTELIVKPALKVATHFKISQMFIGLTILAIGTDLPELVVNVTASIDRLQGIETSGLVYGGIMGSAMGQLALTMGIAGLFGTLFLKKKEIQRDGWMLIIATVALFLLSLGGVLSRVDGLILILLYLFYFTTLQREEKMYEKVKRAEKADLFMSGLAMLGGFVILYFASNAVVDNSLILAEAWGVSQAMIGVLIVGLGTSIPELALALASIRNGASQLSVGNLIGSNIFDLLFALGVSAVIADIHIVHSLVFFDLPFLLLTTVVAISLFWRDYRLTSREALVLIVMYGTYVVLKILGY